MQLKLAARWEDPAVKPCSCPVPWGGQSMVGVCDPCSQARSMVETVIVRTAERP